MKAATLARIAEAQVARRALVVVTRLGDGAQCMVDAAGCSEELSLAPAQLAEAASLLQSGRSGALETLPGSFARAYGRLRSHRDRSARRLCFAGALSGRDTL